MTDAPPPYPGITGNSGYAAPPGATGGIQTGYYDPNQPQMGFIPPPPVPSAVRALIYLKVCLFASFPDHREISGAIISQILELVS